MGGISAGLCAQSVTGILKDVSDSTPISNATVKLISTDSSSNEYSSVSSNKGTFAFNQIPSGDYSLTVTSVGYETTAKIISVGTESTDLGTIAITKGAKTLQTVIVSGAAPPVKQKDDTLEYAASQFKVNPDATAEDLIKKMPGVTVDQKRLCNSTGRNCSKGNCRWQGFFW